MSARLTKTVLLCFVAMSITGCSILKPYEAELGQGNFIREEQIDQLEVGQTPKQVLFLLGTPLLTGEARETRWNYPLKDEQSGYEILSIQFENGLVSNITRQ